MPKTILKRLLDTIIGLVLASIIGAMAGMGAVAFRIMINGLHFVFFPYGGDLLSFFGSYYIILIPAIGGLLLGPVVYFAREARGSGIPEIMKAVAFKGGRIRPIVAPVKAVVSSICIGSGGSAGREGPIIQIGASLASSAAQLLKLSDDQIRTLVTCGAAGGIAATFNAPLAGALFGLEIVLRKVVTPMFAQVLISAVTAKYVAAIFLGNNSLFVLPSFQMVSPIEIVLFGLLGIISALVAVVLIRSMYGCQDIFDRIKLPGYLKPAIGGLLVGLIGLYNINLLGLGYGEIQHFLTGNFSIQFLIFMCILKIIATSFTLGSGGSGGIFSPCLFVGASLGTSFAFFFKTVLPLSIGAPGSYGVVAMAAVFGAAAQAPFTAVVMVSEITGNYSLILPLIAAVGISTAFSTILTRGTIYTTKLRREGIDIENM